MSDSKTMLADEEFARNEAEELCYEWLTDEEFEEFLELSYELKTLGN